MDFLANLTTVNYSAWVTNVSWAKVIVFGNGTGWANATNASNQNHSATAGNTINFTACAPAGGNANFTFACDSATGRWATGYPFSVLPSLVSNGTELEFGQTANASSGYNSTNGEQNITLSRNGTGVNYNRWWVQEANQTCTVNACTLNYSAVVPASQNGSKGYAEVMINIRPPSTGVSPAVGGKVTPLPPWFYDDEEEVMPSAFFLGFYALAIAIVLGLLLFGLKNSKKEDNEGEEFEDEELSE